MTTKPILTPEERENYVLRLMYDTQERVDRSTSSKLRAYIDVLDADFVEGYITATGCSFGFRMIGAHSCRDLSKTLGNLYKQGLLERSRTGMQAPCSGGGWPTWVWSYYIPEGAMKSVKSVIGENMMHQPQNKGGWDLTFVEWPDTDKKEAHTIPVDDLRPHEFDGCWCKPTVDPETEGGPLESIVHNSMDGREDYEEGRRSLN